MGYSPCGHKESDMTEQLSLSPVFLPGEFHGQRSLVGYSPCGHKESDMTEQLTHAHLCAVLVKVFSYYDKCFQWGSR